MSKKISEFTTAGALTGAEIVPLLQSADDKQTTLDLIKAFVMAGGLEALLAISGDAGTQNIRFSTKTLNTLLMLDGSKNVDSSTITIASGVIDFTSLLMKLGNVYSASGRPTFTPDTGAGTAPTVTVTGTNECGFITLTTGTLPADFSNIGKINFNGITYPTGSVPIISAGNAAAAAKIANIFATGTATDATIVINTTGLTAATVYVFYYHIKGY